MSDDERIIEIEVERLRTFPNHPFKVMDDGEMDQLTASIKQYGILEPLIVRPVPEGVYEIVSGHRRKHAAIALGYRKVPVIIRYMKDDEAVIAMVDSNLHREYVTPSEKAFAYKMKNDALRRKSGRKKGGQIDPQKYGKKSVQIIAEEACESPKQIQRYMKLTELIPELLQMLDDRKISFNPAYEVAFLKETEQRLLLEAINYVQSMPSLSQAQRIKRLSQNGGLTLDGLKDILGEVKKGETERVLFKKVQMYQFFPRDYSTDQIKREILDILKQWAEGNQNKGYSK